MLASNDQSQSGGDTGGDAYSSLCRVIEVTRICVFDTLTQYRALFSDDDAGYYASASGSAYLSSSSPGQQVVYRHIFSSWLFQKLRSFLQVC